MIKLELSEDELRRVLRALRSQELAVEDELRYFKNAEESGTVLCDGVVEGLKQISQECFDVAEKIRVQWRATW